MFLNYLFQMRFFIKTRYNELYFFKNVKLDLPLYSAFVKFGLNSIKLQVSISGKNPRRGQPCLQKAHILQYFTRVDSFSSPSYDVINNFFK
jgi:hypothetical protein